MQIDIFSNPAILSPCRTYRYTLTRVWDASLPLLIFIGLNPSTADEKKNDATIKRCMGFAKRLGFGGMLMLNLFAFRSKLPELMKEAQNPIGTDNDWYLTQAMKCTYAVVAIWGIHGVFKNREENVCALAVKYQKTLQCLGLTKGGNPKHPLYLRNDTRLEVFRHWSHRVQVGMISERIIA